MQDNNLTDLSGTEWLFEPARRFIEYFRDASYILNLSINGIEQQGQLAKPGAAAAPKLLQSIQERSLESATDDNAGDTPQKALETWMRLSFFASDETDRGFPIIQSHTLVAFWSALEVFVDDFILSWLSNYPDSLKSEGLSKVKIPLVEFEQLGLEGRMSLLLEEMKRQAKANVTRGVNHFENVLEIIDLNGDVDKRTKDNIYLTQQLRNVIVHRGSIADTRFINACPSLGLAIGQRILVDKELYRRCRDCIEDYFLCLVQRAISRLGYSIPSNEDLASLIMKPILDASMPEYNTETNTVQ